MDYVFLAIGLALGAGGAVILWLLERQRLVSDIARLAAERDGAVRALAEQRELLSATQRALRDEATREPRVAGF